MTGWQDKIFSFGGLIFIIALIPSIVGEMKPDLLTCVITGSVLFVFSLTYASMKFWWSFFVTGLTAVAWFTLAVQQIV